MAADRRDEDVDVEEQADAVADFVEELLTKMDIDAIAEPTEQGGRVYVDILDGDAEDMSLLIGRHGQTLDAIQELARQVVGHRLDQRIKVLVDVEDYRKRRAERIEEKARAAADSVLDSGEEQELEPMDALERKMAHDAVASIDGVRTESRGEDPNRFVVVLPV
ncbi:MAG: R3H domain-containing nucleic acid-binding protein [Actinomycetota bacterium]